MASAHASAGRPTEYLESGRVSRAPRIVASGSYPASSSQNMTRWPNSWVNGASIWVVPLGCQPRSTRRRFSRRMRPGLPKRFSLSVKTKGGSPSSDVARAHCVTSPSRRAVGSWPTRTRRMRAATRGNSLASQSYCSSVGPKTDGAPPASSNRVFGWRSAIQRTCSRRVVPERLFGTWATRSAPLARSTARCARARQSRPGKSRRSGRRWRVAGGSRSRSRASRSRVTPGRSRGAPCWRTG